MTTRPKIYVAGYRGMAGSAIVRVLEQQGQTDIVMCTRAELDFTLHAFFAVEKPDRI